MVDLIVLAIVAFMVLGACAYIRKEKKKGVRCIGCPSSGSCSGSCSGCGPSVN